MAKDFERTPSGGGISNIVEDVTPQLGADLDANGFGITFSELLDIILDTDIVAGNAILLSGAAAGELTDADAVQSFLAITPHINQADTAGYNGILLDVTETATGSGVKNLIDLQVGSSSKFTVDNAGQITKGQVIESLSYAVSDETTALTTGTAKITFRMPYAFTLTDVRSNVTTAPTDATLTVDINETGSTILSTKLTIDSTEKTSTTAATAVVISDTALADDAQMTIDIDQIGSTVAGAGLKVTLIGYRTL